MNKLQKLALAHIKQMAEQLDNDAISLGNKIVLKKEEFEAEKHTYPIARKSREIASWIEAIIESDK